MALIRPDNAPPATYRTGLDGKVYDISTNGERTLDRRQRRRRRRDSGGASGFDDEGLYRDILSAQQALVSRGQKVGREAQQAAQAAGAIEADKLFGAKGLNMGTAEALRGSMSARSAEALGESEAKRTADLMRQAEGLGTQMVEEEAARASRRAEKKASKAGEAGTFASMLGSLGGLAMGAAAIPGVNAAVALPLAIGGLISGGIGAAGSAGARNEQSKARRKLAGIANEAAAFEGPSTQGIESVLSSGAGYEGFGSNFLGSQGNRRPRRAVEEASPYQDYLSSLSTSSDFL